MSGPRVPPPSAIEVRGARVHNTPAQSGGEAQRLKLAGQIDRRQDDALFVFDEPSVGLHPLDVRTLLGAGPPDHPGCDRDRQPGTPGRPAPTCANT